MCPQCFISIHEILTQSYTICFVPCVGKMGPTTPCSTVYSNIYPHFPLPFFVQFLCAGLYHKRSIDTEEKAKVVGAVWGRNLFNSLPHLLFCVRKILKNRMNSPFLQITLVWFSLFFQSSYCKTASSTRNGKNSVTQTAARTFTSLFILLEAVGIHYPLPAVEQPVVLEYPTHCQLSSRLSS